MAVSARSPGEIGVERIHFEHPFYSASTTTTNKPSESLFRSPPRVLAGNAMTSYGLVLTIIFEVAPPPSNVPRLPVLFTIGVQPKGTVEVAERQMSTSYPAVQHAATTVLSHIVGSSTARIALHGLIIAMLDRFAEAFKQKWADRSAPEMDPILDYLTHTPPNIILAAPEDLDAHLPSGQMSWGVVRKGETELQSRNELLLPKDLAEGLEFLTVRLAVSLTYRIDSRFGS